MTVKEFFELEQVDLDFVETKFDGPYWEKVFQFLEQIWHKHVDCLSDKQSQWVHQILEDCVERRLEQ